MSSEFETDDALKDVSSPSRQRRERVRGAFAGSDSRSRVQLLGENTRLGAGLDDADQPRFATPSIHAEAGAAMERQLLLADERAGLSVVRVNRFLLGFFVMAMAVGVIGGTYFIYHQNEESWRADVGAVNAELRSAEGENERLSRENEIAAERLREKEDENSQLAGIASQTLDQLKTSENEARTLRAELVSLRGKYHELRMYRLNELKNLLPQFIRESGLARGLQWLNAQVERKSMPTSRPNEE